MEERQSRSLWATILAGGVALVLLFVVVLALSEEAGRPAPLPATPVPTSADNPAVATVNGEPVGYDVWMEAVRIDVAMSELAGVPPPSPEETLDLLINETLVLQAVAVEPAPDGAEIEAQIAALRAGWGVDEQQLLTTLERAGLDREALTRAVGRLLAVQQAQEELDTGGASVEAWLAEQWQRVDIVKYPDRMETASLPSSLPPPTFVSPSPWPSPSPLPTSTPVPQPSLPSTAIDFTLERGTGGLFTLSDQLAQGPVVLVFFQRCG